MKYLEFDLAKAQEVVEGNDANQKGAKDVAKISKQMDELSSLKLKFLVNKKSGKPTLLSKKQIQDLKNTGTLALRGSEMIILDCFNKTMGRKDEPQALRCLKVIFPAEAGGQWDTSLVTNGSELAAFMEQYADASTHETGADVPCLSKSVTETLWDLAGHFI